jgi:hypothetical protein
MMRDHDHGNVETPQKTSKDSPMEIQSKHYVRKRPKHGFFLAHGLTNFDLFLKLKNLRKFYGKKLANQFVFGPMG